MVISVEASPAVDAVQRLDVEASVAGRTRTIDVLLQGVSIPPAVSFALEFQPDVQGLLEVRVRALGESGETLAQGMATRQIAVGNREDLAVTLGPASMNISMDAGAGDGAGDRDTLAKADAEAPDGAMEDTNMPAVDVNADRSVPADTMVPPPDVAADLPPDVPPRFCELNCTECPCAAADPCRKHDDCATRICGNNATCEAAESCNAVRNRVPEAASGPTSLRTANRLWTTYCEQTGNGGGWTLVLKQNGQSPLMEFSSAFWTTEAELNPEQHGLDQTEAKLFGYSYLPFSQMRVGFAPIGSGQPPQNWMAVVANHTSLKAAITGAPNTTIPGAGRLGWQALLPGFVLAPNCTMEGFNLAGLVRIGIVASDTMTCDPAYASSRIGFGGFGQTSSGSVCNLGCSQPDIRRPAFGYLFVR